MLAWLGYALLNPGPAPYQYHLVEEGDPGKFPDLGMGAWPDLTIRKYEVRVEDIAEPIALAWTGSRGQSPAVLLNWENRTGEQLVSLDSKPADLVTLAGAIKKYAGKDALILGWWDTTRQLQLLSGKETLFPSHHTEAPLITHTSWRERAGAIRQYEDSFWGAAAPAEERKQFERFADAMVSHGKQGAEALRTMAGSREAYVVVHVTDLYRLGLMRPEQFGIAWKDFPMGNNMHGLIGYMKRWMQENKYEIYTLQSLSDKEIRGYFLSDINHASALLAQMMPFTNTRPLELEVLQLIYQQGGYWVYKIPSAAEIAAAKAPEIVPLQRGLTEETTGAAPSAPPPVMPPDAHKAPPAPPPGVFTPAPGTQAVGTKQ